VLAAIISTLYSCTTKTEFSEADYAWINVYEVDDVLVFQEVNSGQKDTTRIIMKELYHPGFQPMSRDFLIPHTFYMYYSNKRETDKGLSGSRLIEMSKDKQSENAHPWIYYKGFSYPIDDEDLPNHQIHLKLSNKAFDNSYKFEKRLRGKKLASEVITSLYWHPELGILQYTTANGEEWERINLPH
jgi:hypothetical protein